MVNARKAWRPQRPKHQRAVGRHDAAGDPGAGPRLPEPSRDRADTVGVREAFVLIHRGDLARLVRNLLDKCRRVRSRECRRLADQRQGDVVLVVDDDGPGIPARHRETASARFGRVDDSRSRQAGGAGLGLAIVNDIVLRHHGTVTVPDGPRDGALFCVRLPAD